MVHIPDLASPGPRTGLGADLQADQDGGADTDGAAAAPAVCIEHARQTRALRELAASESYSRALFHATLTGLMIVDPLTERIMDINGAAAEILGADADDLFGRPAGVFGIGSICEQLRWGVTCIERRETSLCRRDDSAVPVILSVQTIRLGERDMAVISFVDISTISAVQEQLRQSNLQLNEALRQLQTQRDAVAQSEKMASIGQLAAGVAHEINNPIAYISSNLAAMSVYADLMRTVIGLYRRLVVMAPDDPERSTVQGQLDSVLEEEDLDYVLGDLDAVLRESMEGTTRVADIVQDLKSFAREDSLQKQPHDLNEGVESVIRMVWNELKYSCSVETDLGEVPPVVCHAGQINQVIMNILVNAAHAVGPGGGTIAVRTSAIDDEARIEISDSGCGMTPEVLSHIFEPFFTTKDVGHGTGLGLSISHGIIANHGGRIEVSSEAGLGATFRIILPLNSPEAGDMLA